MPLDQPQTGPAAAQPEAAKFDALVFDCDGVFAQNSEDIAFEVVAKLVNDHLSRHRAPQYEQAELVRKYAGKHFIHIQAGVEEDTGVRIPDEMEQDITTETARRLRTETKIDPGLNRLIEAFQKDGAGIGMNSSSPHPRLAAPIHAARLTKLMSKEKGNVISAPEDTGQPKPAPDGYLLTAERLGADPEKSISLEDSTSGVESGVRAGYTVIGYMGATHIKPEDYESHRASLMKAGATIVVDTMDEAIEMKPYLEKKLAEKLAARAEAAPTDPTPRDLPQPPPAARLAT